MNQQDYLALVAEILDHDKSYFVDQKPMISDYEYDKLYKKLLLFEESNPQLIVKHSPTQTINEPPGLKKHLEPMLSLSNTYSEDEIARFVKRIKKQYPKATFCVDLKIDGASVGLKYKNGKLIQALTRGNGIDGEDITSNVATIKALQSCSYKGADILEIKGEIFLPKKRFKILNEWRANNGLEEFANARNAAAGSLKLLDANEMKKRGLEMICYGMADAYSFVKSQRALHAFIGSLKLPAFEKRYIFSACDTKDILAIAHHVEKIRPQLTFDIDGIVIKVDDLLIQKKLGFTSKAPKYATAYKFAPEQAETQILDIVVQVGKSGILTPTALFKPTHLAGSTIQRATLHNEEEIARKDIRIGDFVIIEKGGDVIPKISKVVLAKRRATKKWYMPKRCPSCDRPVVKQKNEVALRCINMSCKEQIIRKTIFFVSKNAMDIENLGESLIRIFYERHLLTKIADIYRLTKKKLLPLEGIQERLATKIVANIESSKKRALFRLILGLSIPYVGTVAAQAIAEKARTLGGCFRLTKEKLLSIDGIGAVVADSFIKFFKNDANIAEVNSLIELGVSPTVNFNKDHHFYGKTFVITGTFGHKRSALAKMITAKGGIMGSSVGGRTDFLLVGERPGSKLAKAKKLKVKRLSEEDFLKLLRS